MVPMALLVPKFKKVSLVRIETWAGRLPVSLLAPKLMYTRPVNVERVAGMGPVMEFELSMRLVRPVRFPTAGSSWKFKPRALALREVTRLLVQVTPFQVPSQGPVVLVQERALGYPHDAYMAKREDLSLACTVHRKRRRTQRNKRRSW